MKHQQIVQTVRDQHGAWAMFTDDAKADLYAARVHGVRGPPMTREQARRLVEQTNHNDAPLADSAKISHGVAPC